MLRRAMLFALLAAVLVTPAQAASFEFKGVIEGFYGPPWPAHERVEFIRWMVDHGMNTYVHAPKNDPYQRLRWRQPYPASEMAQFEREVAVGRPSGFRWIPSISPALPAIEVADERDRDICFSCPEDRAVLFAKLDAFWAIGVRQLMLSFDDTIKQSTHPEDAQAYGAGDGAYGTMNADLLNAVYERYAPRDPSFRLLTVPVDYSGTSSTPYLDAFRSKLRPEVVVMWTGTQVVAPEIKCAEANAYAEAIGRKPLVWDNFPVNDYAADKLMLGPYRGRGPDLPSCLAGVLANPANQVVANRIPLFTVADYLNGPSAYDPERSWEASLREFAGPFRGLLGHFVENVRSTALDRTEAVRFSALRDAFLAALGGPDWPKAHDAFAAELKAAAAAPEQIRSSFPDRQFVNEVENVTGGALTGPVRDYTGTSWLERLGFTSRNALEAAEAVARTRPRVVADIEGDELVGQAAAPMTPEQLGAVRPRIAGLRTRDDGNPDNVYGDRAFVPLGPPFVDENRADAFFDAANQQLSDYAATAQQASSAVTLTVDGKPVDVGLGGRFAAPVAGREAVAVVTDGAGRESRYVFTNPAAAPSPHTRPVLRIGRLTRVRVRNGTAVIPLTCRSARTSCSGRLTLTSGSRRIARTRFLVPDGVTVRVRAKLTRSGRALLRRRRTLPVVARATAADEAGRRAIATRRGKLAR